MKGEIEPQPGPEPESSERRLRVIGAASIGPALDIAVSRALRKRMPEYDANAVTSVQNTVKREFRRLLRDNTKSVRGVSRDHFMSELKRSRDGILAARNRAREELDDLRSTTDLLKNLQAADQKALVEHGEDFAERHTAELQLAFMDVFERARTGELSQRQLRDALVETAATLAKEQWARAIGLRLKENEEDIQNYERRISKLMESLSRTEEALSRLAKMKEGDPGIASIYRTVQGLAQNVEGFAKKRALLEEIFQANVVLQKVAPA